MNILFLYKNFSRFFYKTFALFSRTVQILLFSFFTYSVSLELSATFISRGEYLIQSPPSTCYSQLVQSPQKLLLLQSLPLRTWLIASQCSASIRLLNQNNPPEYDCCWKTSQMPWVAVRKIWALMTKRDLYWIEWEIWLAEPQDPQLQMSNRSF